MIYEYGTWTLPSGKSVYIANMSKEQIEQALVYLDNHPDCFSREEFVKQKRKEFEERLKFKKIEYNGWYVSPNETSSYKPHDNSSNNESAFFSGFLLGLFLSIIGVIIAYAIGRPNQTKGASIGMLVEVVISAIVVLVVVLSKRQFYI